MSDNAPLLEISNVSKAFPGVLALDNVSMSVYRGELMALLGENGAGKSTLVKILSGAYQRDTGSIRVNGQELPKSFTPSDARDLGIAIIYQELSLLPHLSIAENIYKGREPLSIPALRVIDYKRMNQDAKERLAQLKADRIPVTTPVGSLSTPEQQLVEIASALAVNCSVVIMDEPTTALTSEETQQLFGVIEALKQQNVTIIYISHRMDEIFQIADRATVLRDGKLVGTVKIAETSNAEIISMMTGREIKDIADLVVRTSTTKPLESELLRVEGLGNGRLLKDISFALNENEVLGIAGLVGSGRSELVRMISGADKKVAGRVFVSGKEVHFRSPRHALDHGIGYLSENRKTEGLNLGLSLENNIGLTDLASVSTAGVVNQKKLTSVATAFIDRMKIRGTPRTRAVSLSGGNQQKVVIAKWLHVGCKVLIFDEPTKGIDVIAKSEVMTIIQEFVATGGRGAIVISSELEDLLTVCNRILVMSKGRVTHVLTNSEDLTADLLLDYVTRGQ